MVIQNIDSINTNINSNNTNTNNETNFNKRQFWTYERFYEKGHRGGGKENKHKLTKV